MGVQKLATQVRDLCRRGVWYVEDIGSYVPGTDTVDNEQRTHMGWEDQHRLVSTSSANLVGSLCMNGKHAPCLDIDFPARLVPSSTEGHFHLYLDREISWEKYAGLIRAMAEAGILEKGYVQQSLKRGQSFLRRPGVTKQPEKAKLSTHY